MTASPAFSETIWRGRRAAALASPHFASVADGEGWLREAEGLARRQGFAAAVGPMAGDSWGVYRVALWSDGSPPFFGEPPTGPFDLEAYLAAGYSVAEAHSSAVAAPGSRGFCAAGPPDATVRAWDGLDPAALLADAHGVVMQAFARAPFFRPLPLDRFVAAYLPFLSRADPRFVLVARERNGRPIGFTLAFPDPLRPAAVVLKTYAGLTPGIGRRMADVVHATAAVAGFSEVIHALMRDGIASASQSRKFGGRVIRRYALMGKIL